MTSLWLQGWEYDEAKGVLVATFLRAPDPLIADPAGYVPDYSYRFEITPAHLEQVFTGPVLPPPPPPEPEPEPPLDPPTGLL